MKQSNYSVQVIEPSEGYYLTRKDNKGEILSKKVFLSINDSADNWEEIGIEEGDKLHAEIEKQHEEEAKQNEATSEETTKN